jgi:hypothetical protein
MKTILVVVVLLAAVLVAEAQQAKKIPIILFLAGGEPGHYREIFRQTLRDRRYTDGENMAIERQLFSPPPHVEISR